MKKLLSIIAALACLVVVNVEGASATGVYTSAATNSLLSVGGVAKSLLIANSAASASTVTFFDAPSTDLTYTLAAYTNTTSYTTNLTNVYVTTTGISQTNISENVLVILKQQVAASTNNYATISTFTVPASSTLTYTFGGAGTRFMNGVCVTNSTNANITLTYVPDL